MDQTHTITKQRSKKKVVPAQLTIGIDLGDRWSHYCVLNRAGEIVEEGLCISETSFRLREWQLFDVDLVVRFPVDVRFDAPFTGGAGAGDHRAPSPDRGAEAICPETAETDFG